MVILDDTMESICLGTVPASETIIEIKDEGTGLTHYSRYRSNNPIDLLPNGALYLSDDFEEAKNILNNRSKGIEK